jgi:hypothetical protein
MKIAFALAAAALSMIWLTACSSNPVVPTTGVHPPTTPDQVQLFDRYGPPKKYEILGTVSLVITPALRWDDRGDANAAFTQLIQQAAALGANGIYFNGKIPEATVVGMAGYHGIMYEVPIQIDPTTQSRTAIGTAVWVVQ